VNFYFFSLKRSFHAALRVTRGVAAAFGLTPARADMLYAIFRVPVASYEGTAAGRGALTQRELRTELGVSAPTVSRMVRSLEELGFVTRSRSIQDGRTLDIRLTDDGWRRVRAMFLEIFKWDIFGLALDCALTRTPLPTNDDELGRWRYDLYDLTTRIRRAFRDHATLEYPNFDPDSAPNFRLGSRVGS
jgi:DNA-binding MarR family transcriptional regulator